MCKMSKIELIETQSKIYNLKIKLLNAVQAIILAGLFALPAVAYLLD